MPVVCISCEQLIPVHIQKCQLALLVEVTEIQTYSSWPKEAK
jgi:hypothetical protein